MNQKHTMLGRMQYSSTGIALMIVILAVTHLNVILTSPVSSSGANLQANNVELQDKQYQNVIDGIAGDGSPYDESQLKESNEVEERKPMERFLSFLKVPSTGSGGSRSSQKNWMQINRAIMERQHKRQIRYQQCYFNPISCF